MLTSVFVQNAALLILSCGMAGVWIIVTLLWVLVIDPMI
jgi:hypothetical protein